MVTKIVVEPFQKLRKEQERRLHSSSPTRRSSYRSFVQASLQLIKLANCGNREAQSMDQEWNTERSNSTNRLCDFMANPVARPTGLSVDQFFWIKLEKLQTGIGRFFAKI